MKFTKSILFPFICLLILSPIAFGQQFPSSSAPPGVKAGRTLLVDGTNGNNATAARGRLDKMFQTIQAAITAAAAGDTVQVRSGDYGEFVTIKHRVDIVFDPGAKIYHTSGSGNCISDGGVEADCKIYGLNIDATSSSGIKGVVLTSPDSNVIINAVDISMSGTSSRAIEISGATTRIVANRLSAEAECIYIFGGTNTINAQTADGDQAVFVSGGSNVITIDRLNAPCEFQAGDNTLSFRLIDDTTFDLETAIANNGSTLTIIGGSLPRTNNGDAVVCASGECTIQSIDITGSFTGGWVALNEAGGTLNILPNVHYPAGETSGVITRKNLFGKETSDFALTLLDDADAAALRNTLGASLGVWPISLGGRGADTLPAFSVHKNGTNQSITSSTFTQLTWSTEAFDTDSAFGSNAFTPQEAGKYLLILAAGWANATTSSVPLITIYKNGVEHKRLVWVYMGLASAGSDICGVCVVEANGTTDSFQAYVYHDDTAPRSVLGDTSKTFFQGFFIRP